jgi:hypothetical protein
MQLYKSTIISERTFDRVELLAKIIQHIYPGNSTSHVLLSEDLTDWQCAFVYKGHQMFIVSKQGTPFAEEDRMQQETESLLRSQSSNRVLYIKQTKKKFEIGIANTSITEPTIVPV